MKCIEGKIKTFSFLFCTACDPKNTKDARINIQSDRETMYKKKTNSSSVFTRCGKVQKSGEH